MVKMKKMDKWTNGHYGSKDISEWLKWQNVQMDIMDMMDVRTYKHGKSDKNVQMDKWTLWM